MSEYHVASFIAYSFPKHQATVRAEIETKDGFEVHGEDPDGRLIVTVEGTNQRDLVAGFEELQNIPHMLNVAPIYHEYTDEASDTTGVH